MTTLRFATINLSKNTCLVRQIYNKSRCIYKICDAVSHKDITNNVDCSMHYSFSTKIPTQNIFHVGLINSSIYFVFSFMLYDVVSF